MLSSVRDSKQSLQLGGIRSSREHPLKGSIVGEKFSLLKANESIKAKKRY